MCFPRPAYFILDPLLKRPRPGACRAHRNSGRTRACQSSMPSESKSVVMCCRGPDLSCGEKKHARKMFRPACFSRSRYMALPHHAAPGVLTLQTLAPESAPQPCNGRRKVPAALSVILGVCPAHGRDRSCSSDSSRPGLRVDAHAGSTRTGIQEAGKPRRWYNEMRKPL